MLCSVAENSRARYHQCPAALAHHDQDLHIGIRQQVESVVVNRAKGFPHTAHPARHDLFGNFFGMTRPGASRFRIPCDRDILIRLKRAEIGLVHKGTHANVPQIGHFRQRGSDLHKIAHVHRQRIQRAVGGCGDGCRTHFFLKRLDQILGLADAQARALHDRRRTLGQVLFLGLQRLKISAGLGQAHLSLGEFVLRGGMLGHQALECLFVILKVRHLHLRGLQVAVELRNLIRWSSGSRVAEVILDGKQIGARLRELGSHLGGVQGQDDLSAAHRLTLGRHYLVHKRRELGAGHSWRNRLDLAVTGDRGAQILARDAHDLDDRRLTAQGQNGQDGDREHRGQYPGNRFSLAVFRHDGPHIASRPAP